MKTYVHFRQAGYTASESHRNAKICKAFEALHRETKAKLCAEPEFESYFDVYGEPEGYTNIHGRHITPEQERKAIEDSIERNGCWCVVSYFWNEETEKWEAADSVGMCIYDRPLCPVENCYVPDLMRSAIEAYENNAVSYQV